MLLYHHHQLCCSQTYWRQRIALHIYQLKRRREIKREREILIKLNKNKESDGKIEESFLSRSSLEWWRLSSLSRNCFVSLIKSIRLVLSKKKSRIFASRWRQMISAVVSPAFPLLFASFLLAKQTNKQTILIFIPVSGIQLANKTHRGAHIISIDICLLLWLSFSFIWHKEKRFFAFEKSIFSLRISNQCCCLLRVCHSRTKNSFKGMFL